MTGRGPWRATGAVLALAMLAACNNDPGTAESDEAPASPAAEGLDALALESGALPDRDETEPAGRYGRRYDGGSDSFCLVPDGSARGRYRFGAETRIGGDEYCRGTGMARRAGDKLLLRFEGRGGDCRIVARYEGDKIVMPGGLDVACAAVCSSRGSFAGVAFPRIDRDVAAARRMQDRDQVPLCR